jgi:hemolysin activation/secretion protein
MFGTSRTHAMPGWLAAIAMAGSSAAIAQVAPDAGTTLRQLEPPVLTLPRKPPPAVEVEAPARPALEPAPAVRFVLKAFRISGVTVFAQAELQALVQEFVGREVGIADLGDAVGRITGFYSERGYPLATAYLPAQDIAGGVVEILVLEGRYGNLQLLNRTHVGDSVIARHVQGLQGGVVQGPALERKLLLLHDLPGAAPGRAVLSPGQAVGETDLRVELEAGRRATGTIELDNYGSRFTGATRLSGQFDLYSPLRLGDWLSVRAAKGDPGLEYARAGYQLPVGGDGLKVGAIYSRVEYRLGKDFAALDATGEAETWSLITSYPIVRSRRHNLYGRLIAERRDLQDRVDATATVSDRKSTTATLSLNGDYFDALGKGAASAYSLAYTGGTLRVETPAQRVIDDASARTHGGFHRWNVGYARQQGLGERTALYVSFFGQKAGKNLDSSEKMILGGINGVRAYPQGEAPGDSGYLLNVELRYAFNVTALPGAWQTAVFLDTGEVRINENPFNAQPNRRRLSGGGLGIEWSQASNFSLRLAVAQRIGNQRATAGSDDRTRGWLQAIKYF